MPLMSSKTPFSNNDDNHNGSDTLFHLTAYNLLKQSDTLWPFERLTRIKMSNPFFQE